MALEQKRHSFVGALKICKQILAPRNLILRLRAENNKISLVMNFAGNFDDEDLMKRLS